MNPAPIDLSKIPEPLRSKLQAQLARLPPEMRQQLLERGSPMIDRAIENARHLPGAGRLPAKLPQLGSGKYNQTVRPGDRIHVSLGMTSLLLLAMAALYYLYD